MQLSLITPVAHLGYTDLLPGRFCIAPVAKKFDSYHDYFAEASTLGYDVILDNGVFENHVLATEEYLDLAVSIRPKVLVIPDIINAGSQANYEAAVFFVDTCTQYYLKHTTPMPELMFVPQCELNETIGFLNALDRAIDNVDFKWLGICRDVVRCAFSQYTGTEDQEMNRFFFGAWASHTSRMRLWQAQGKKIHFLGMGNVFRNIQYHWYVDSMDTASLFYMGTQGIGAEQGIFDSRLRRPDDYFRKVYDSEDDWGPIVKYNCQQAELYTADAVYRKRQIQGGRM